MASARTLIHAAACGALGWVAQEFADGDSATAARTTWTDELKSPSVFNVAAGSRVSEHLLILTLDDSRLPRVFKRADSLAGDIAFSPVDPNQKIRK
jgi:hypothetical protein